MVPELSARTTGLLVAAHQPEPQLWLHFASLKGACLMIFVSLTRLLVIWGLLVFVSVQKQVQRQLKLRPSHSNAGITFITPNQSQPHS